MESSKTSLHDTDKINTSLCDYEEAFRLTGYGRFNYIVLLACSIIFMYCSLEMAGLAYVITPAECDLKLSITEKSMVNAGIFIGIIVTSVCWGLASDRFGRRKLMLPTILAAVLASFGSSLCTAFWAMFLLRILTGALVSASTATVLVYLSELSTENKRDFAVSFAIASDQFNFVALPVVAYVIIRGSWSFNMGSILVKPWRVFMWYWGFLGLLGALILFFLPESPRFILASEGALSTLPILAKIYACNHGKKPEDYPISFVRTRSAILHSSHSGIKSIILDVMQLLQPPLRRCYLITHFCMFIIYLLANGVYIWLPAFINEGVLNYKQKYSICDVIRFKYITKNDNSLVDPHEKEDCAGEFSTIMYPVSLVMEVIFLFPYIIILYLINKVNLLKMYGYVSLFCGISMIVSCVIPQIVVAILTLIIGLCSGCLVSIITALGVQAFPTSLRALALCTMFMIGQLGAIFGVSAISFMHGHMCHVIFGCFIAALISSGFILYRYWPDLSKVREEMENRNFCY